MSTDRVCRTCAKATTAPGHTRHYKLGLRNCRHLPEWRFVSGHHFCERWAATDNHPKSESLQGGI